MISARAFASRIVIALVLVCTLTAAAMYEAYRIAAAKVAKVAVAPIDPSVLEPGGNYLLIGSDTRAFVRSAADQSHFGSSTTQTGQRSDTIMVAHVGSDGRGLLVSFPRDLWVDIPGMGQAKINAAFNAGPQRVIETIERDFNVPISHYLEVDFSGFRSIVNAIGSVPIYFPTPARDLKSGLAIRQRGCQHLSGDQALAYVRSRYYESYVHGSWQSDPLSDLSRIRRQQYFLRTLSQQIIRAAEHQPWRAGSLLDKLLASLTRDPRMDLSAFRALAYAMRGSVAPLDSETLPTNRAFRNGQDALILDTAKAAPLLARLRAGAEPPVPTNVDAASVHVIVQNGSGTPQAAQRAYDALRRLKFAMVPPPTNADRSDYDVTEVRYAPGARTKARYVLAQLNGSGKLVALDNPPGSADVVVVIGRDLPDIHAPTSTTGAAKAPSSGGTKTSGPRRASSTPASLPAVGC